MQCSEMLKGMEISFQPVRGFGRFIAAQTLASDKTYLFD